MLLALLSAPILAICAAVTFQQEAQTATAVEPRWKQLSVAYSFVRAQDSALQRIQTRFPDLQARTREMQSQFTLCAFGEGFKGVAAELANTLGDDWPAFRESADGALAQLAASYDPTREEAAMFLAEVRERIAGKMPLGVDATLLSANTRYVAQPALEIIERHCSVYRTANHEKAAGVDLSIRIPQSWICEEGHRPHVVQAFKSNAGHGTVGGSVLITDAVLVPQGETLTDQDITEAFKPSELAAMVPDGGTLVLAKSITLEARPAGMLVYDLTQARLDVAVVMRITQFVTIYRERGVYLSFYVYGEPGQEGHLSAEQEQWLPTFTLIANSLVINGLYRQQQ